MKWFKIVLFFSIVLHVIPVHAYANHDPGSKYTLLVFEGSDWCVNCIRLERNILQDSSIVSFLEKNDILIERIDFPQRKQLDSQTVAYNSNLADQYDFQGQFPTVILVDTKNGKSQKLILDQQKPEKFEAELKSAINNFP